MPTTNFNPTNPESLQYHNEFLQLTVLGGIKLEGLDRMRVTLKLELQESSVPPVRHNLDLYNDNQLEKLIRKVAERLELGTSLIAASLSELTEELEAYRLERIEEQEGDQNKQRQLTDQETKEATAFLESDHLLDKTNELIGNSGVIGEVSNRLLMYLIFTSRKQEQPLHIVSLGSSGTGKTHLQESVGNLIPDEDKIEITTLSENAFYYFNRTELKNKLILIEDLDGAESALYPIRELQSKKRITKTISRKDTKGNTKTITLTVEGPVSVGGCTTRESIYEDNSNRSFLIYLDESAEQDEKVMEYQRALAAGKVDDQERQSATDLLQNAQRLLKPIKVVNPYAELLALPKEVFKPRRTNSHYLQFISAITFYHQFQREQKVNKDTGEIYIETTLEDIEQANQLLKEALLRKSDRLTGACRNHFERLKLFMVGEKENRFTNREISQKFRMGLTTVKDHHKQLFELGYLKYEQDKNSRTRYYQIISYKEYESLQSQIDTVLDKTLSKLQKPKGRKTAEDKARPSKSQKTNKKETVAG